MNVFTQALRDAANAWEDGISPKWCLHAHTWGVIVMSDDGTREVLLCEECGGRINKCPSRDR